MLWQVNYKLCLISPADFVVYFVIMFQTSKWYPLLHTKYSKSRPEVRLSIYIDEDKGPDEGFKAREAPARPGKGVYEIRYLGADHLIREGGYGFSFGIKLFFSTPSLNYNFFQTLSKANNFFLIGKTQNNFFHHLFHLILCTPC